MKKLLLITLFTLAFGWTLVKATPQANSTKSDLISLFRSDATALLSVRAKIRAHKASYDALGFTWADGDFTGSNAGITATQFTTAVTNLTDVCDKFDLGGSLAVGIPTTINRIANVNLSDFDKSPIFSSDALQTARVESK